MNLIAVNEIRQEQAQPGERDEQDRRETGESHDGHGERHRP